MRSLKLTALSASLSLILGQAWAENPDVEAAAASKTGVIVRDEVPTVKVTTPHTKLPVASPRSNFVEESLAKQSAQTPKTVTQQHTTVNDDAENGVMEQTDDTLSPAVVQEVKPESKSPPVVAQTDEDDSPSQKVIIPEFVHKIETGESGYNHSNPTWTNDGSMLGFERHDERNKEILITKADGEIVQTVKYQSDEGDDLGLGALLPDFAENVSYNAGLSWSPDNQQFIFMSNGSEANYDLYMGSMGQENLTRLTDNSEKDGHANWAPSGASVAFISGRGGNADIYLLDTMTKQVTQLGKSTQPFLYPTWSPNGTQLAVIHGSNENHNIFIYDNVPTINTQRKLISWDYDDLRPMWSPDGKYVAFYTNYNDQNDPKLWSIAVVNANEHELKTVAEIAPLVVATNIIPDVDKGPSWTPDSRHLVFVENNRKKYNPIMIVNVDTKSSYEVKTETRINHDVSCSKQGIIAFRSQVDQWDHIFVAKIPDLNNLAQNSIEN
ncbi:MAG: hypothetical protein OEZ43_15115 [Gammaproteobacteria bacterium]|nr:hypothetical protein [Gammaproteobacteria bacterium]